MKKLELGRVLELKFDSCLNVVINIAISGFLTVFVQE